MVGVVVGDEAEDVKMEEEGEEEEAEDKYLVSGTPQRGSHQINTDDECFTLCCTKPLTESAAISTRRRITRKVVEWSCRW